MLSLENLQLCQRDQAIQGLGFVLQPDEVHSALQQHGLTNLQSVILQYLRYKPQRRCIGLFEVAWNTSTGPNLTALVATAMTVDSWNKFTVHRADSAIANGAILLPSKRVALEWFPHDHTLKRVSKVVSASSRNKVLSRILQTDHLECVDLKMLAYKPARRYVACGMSQGRPVFTLKTYTNSGYTDAEWRIRLATEYGLSNCRVLGNSPRYNSIATSWVEGQTLSQWMLTDDCSLPIFACVGQELAKWHARSQNLVTHIPSDANHVCQITSLNELADDIGVLAPVHAGRAQSLSRQIQTGLSELPPAQDLIHGDFYAKQVILTQCAVPLRPRDECAASLRRRDDFNQIHFIDFDELRLGDRYEDIANFIAKNHWQTVLEGLDRRRCKAINQNFIDGYASQLGTIDNNRLRLHVSLALFRCVPHAFRRALPNWTNQMEALLNEVEDWLRPQCQVQSLSASPSASSSEVNSYLDIHQVNKSLLLAGTTVDASLESLKVESAKLLRHKPSRRLLVEYSLVDSERPDQTKRVLGKARLSKSLDTKTPRLHHQLQQYDWSRSEIAFPKALGVMPSMSMWLQERVDGTGVYPNSRSSDLPADLATHTRVGRALADFHQAHIPVDRCFGVTNELDKLSELFSQLGNCRPEWNEDLCTVERYCRNLAIELPIAKVVPIHRDFYFDQVLVSKAKVYLLDLDLVSMGPAELDVGNYLAHLDEYGIRVPEEQENCHLAAERFLKGYLDRSSSADSVAISIWRELSLARHIAISNQIPGRQHTSVRLLQRFVSLAEDGHLLTIAENRDCQSGCIL